MSTAGQYALVCTKIIPSEGSQALPTSGVHWMPAHWRHVNMVSGVLLLRRGKLHLYFCRNDAPLEVQVPGSMGLQVGQQDFGWSGCLGSVQGLSRWWC